MAIPVLLPFAIMAIGDITVLTVSGRKALRERRKKRAQQDALIKALKAALKRGVTLAQIAERFETNVDTVSRWTRRGRGHPDPTYLNAIIKVLNAMV